MFIFTLSQCLKKISLSHYMVLVSSQGYTRIMVGTLWMITVCFTFLPTIFDPSMIAKWKNEMVVRSSKYYKVSIVVNVIYFLYPYNIIHILLWKFVTFVIFYLQHHVLQRLQGEERQNFHHLEHKDIEQSFCYLKEYWSFEYWLLIAVGSSFITVVFFLLCISARFLNGTCKGKALCNNL